MQKWNEYPRRKYLSNDKYQGNQNKYSPDIYPSNNFNNINQLYLASKYRNDSNIRNNNNQVSNNNINIRNNKEINNLNSKNYYHYNNGLGNPDIGNRDKDNYQKRYGYSYDKYKRNAGDLYNKNESNNNRIPMKNENNNNKGAISDKNSNYQDYLHRAQRKFHPLNYKDHRINNRPESENKQEQPKKYPQQISYDKKSQNNYKNDDLMGDLDINIIRNIQKTKDVNQIQEHNPYQNTNRNNNQMKPKINNYLRQDEEKILNSEFKNSFGEKNRNNNINDKQNKLNERKNQNTGNNFRRDNNIVKNNNVDNKNNNYINNQRGIRPDFNEKHSERIFDKDKQLLNKNNGEPIKIKNFKEFEKNEKQKEEFKNPNYLNINNIINNKISGQQKNNFEKEQKENNQMVNDDNHNNKDKNHFYRRNQDKLSNEVNKKIENNMKDDFSKPNLDKFKDDKNNNNKPQIDHNISKKFKNDISNRVNNPVKQRYFSVDKANHNQKKPYSDELKKEQNGKQKKEFDYGLRPSRYEKNNNNEQISSKNRNNQSEQKKINFGKEDLISTKMVLGKDNNQINKIDYKYEYIYDNNIDYTKKILQPFLNKEKNIQGNNQQLGNNFANNNNNNFNNNNNNNNKINSNDNFMNNKNNNNLQLIQNANNNKNQNFKQQNNFNFNNNNNNMNVNINMNNNRVNKFINSPIKNNMNINNNQFNNANNKIKDNMNIHNRAKSSNNIAINNLNDNFGMKNNNNFNNNNINNKFNVNQNQWNQNLNNNAIIQNNQFNNNNIQRFQNNNFNQNNNINQNKMNNNFHFNNNQPVINNNFGQMNHNFQNFNNNVNAVSPIKNNFINNQGFLPNNNFNNFNNGVMNRNLSPNIVPNINNNFIPNNFNGFNMMNGLINQMQNLPLNTPQMQSNQSNHKRSKSCPGLRKNYPIKKLCANGLQNIGATCYMNATLQCLAHVESLTKNLLSKKIEIKNNRYKNQLTNAFLEVLENMWENNSITYYAPYNFKNLISKMNPLFEGVQANDSKDLVLFLLETMHNELNKVKNLNPQYEDAIDQYNFEKSFMSFAKYFEKNFQSVISDIFYGMYNSRMMCHNCRVITHNIQCYNLLIIPLEEVRKFKNRIQNYVTIRECFEYYQKPDYMVGQNQIYCNNCKQMANSENNTTLIVGPKVLVINLNRGKGLQFNIKIDFDEYINIYDFIYFKTTNYRYKLIGVVTHFGPSSDSGHFIAFCKSFVDLKWYKYNDAMVNQSSFNEAKNTGVPYILFYSAE